MGRGLYSGLNQKKIEAARVAHGHQQWVASFLETLGIPARVPEFRPRLIPSLRPCDDGGDVLVEDEIIEVKCPRCRFTSLDDFPFDPAIVDAQVKWDSLSKKPIAVIDMDEKTHGMMFIPVKETRWAWTVENRYVRTENQRKNFYLCSLNFWKRIDSFREWFLGRTR